MPIYEYKAKEKEHSCKYCVNPFEVMQEITEKPLEECPECGGLLEKIVSQTHFKLEGTGWSGDGYSKKP